VHQDYLYVIGGLSANQAQSEIYYTKVASDGTIDYWARAWPLPDAVFYHTVVKNNKRLIVIGGKKNDTETSQQIYMSTIDTNGALSQWLTLPSLPAPFSRFAAVATPLTALATPQYSTQAIHVLGGLHEEKSRKQVYYSLFRLYTFYLPVVLQQ